MKQLGLFLLGAIFLVSCSETHSEVSYKYMKAPSPGLAAKVGDVKVTNEELENQLKLELYQAEKDIFQLKENTLKQILLQRLVDKDPQSKGMNLEDYISKHVARNIKVSKKEIEEFAKEQNIPAQHMNDRFKEQIKKYIEKTKEKEYVESWMAKKLGSTVEVYFEKPKRPSFPVPEIGKSPTFGPEDAPVTIYEYSDFQCPHCSQAVPTINKIKKKYKGKVRVVYKNFPLPNHTEAKNASLASMCVNEINKDLFWKYHNKVFENQRFISTETLKKYASELGVDNEKFTKCFSEKKYADLIEKDVSEGQKIGVKSTPTFFVNGKIIMGAQPLEVFEEVIKESL